MRCCRDPAAVRREFGHLLGRGLLAHRQYFGIGSRRRGVEYLPVCPTPRRVHLRLPAVLRRPCRRRPYSPRGLSLSMAGGLPG